MPSASPAAPRERSPLRLLDPLLPGAHRHRDVVPVRWTRAGRPGAESRRGVDGVVQVQPDRLPVQLRVDHTPVRDRKSTRLNSSHVAISYAVFCLKKKTANKITARALKLSRRRQRAGG